MFEEVFLKSIVKGIGKATGTMIILGIVGGGAWYVSLQKKTTKTKKQVKEAKKTKETQTVQMEPVDQSENEKEDQIEHMDIQESHYFLQSENKYKSIFDKL